MKTILEMNSFDPNRTADFGEELASGLRRRKALFGAASVLFYDRPLEFVRGEGCWLYDADGLGYLDAYNNVPSVGHCHPDVVAAASRQLNLLNVHNRYLHPGVLNYAEALLATLPESLSNVTFTCTGSESNDLALRIAARFTGGVGVIVTRTAYHGNTDLSSEVSPASFANEIAMPQVRTIAAPDARLVGSAQLADHFAARVAEAIADFNRQGLKFSALLVDNIFSSDGVFADPPGFLRAAVEVVHRAGGVLIADEVQCGFGRMGTSMWGFERHGVLPDIVTLGKPMGNGYPMGAVVTRPDILDAFCRHVGYFNTFGGSPVAAAVGQAVLNVIARECLIPNAAQVGRYLKQRLNDLRTRHPSIADVRGAGLYVGLELIDHRGAPASALAQAVVNGMRNRQVLIGTAGEFGQVLKFRPPLCFSIANADVLVAALDDALVQLATQS